MSALSRSKKSTGLIEKLLVVDGRRLVIADPSDDTRAEYRRAIHQAKQGNQIPDGLKLRHTGRDAGALVIWLEEAQPEKPAPPKRISVPTTLRSPHALIADWRQADHPDGPLPGVSKMTTPRALRILNALFREAERRGYDVALPGPGDGRPGRETPLFVVVIGVDRYGFSLHEELDRSEFPSSQPNYDWQRTPIEVKKVPSGRLVLVSHAARSLYWADRKRWTLDDKLGHALAECERRAAEAMKVREEAKSRAERSTTDWEKAVGQARAAHVQHLNRQHLFRLVKDADTARGIRVYLERLDASTAISKEWIEWARGEADQIDPGLEAANFVVPVADEVTADDLDRWIPNGWTSARPPDLLEPMRHRIRHR